MVISHLLTHGFIYAVVAIGSLFVLMVTTSPRVWGYADYPEAIKSKIPPQTSSEKRLATLVALPWLIFVLVFPIVSTYMLKSKLGNEIPFWTAFLNMLWLVLLANLGDIVILDWLLITKITPKFVIIPGTEVQDYKDFSHHFHAHGKASIIQLFICVLIAGIASW